jgi:selenide,water dikinase
MIEAECSIIGGHSVRDEEMKFGYSVTGLIHPNKVLKNGGAKAGDRLLFTKALGTGVISTAIKKGAAKQSWIDAAIRSMTTLNKAAAEVITGRMQRDELPDAAREGRAHQYAIHAMTDVTGFGLIAHSREMALSSEVSLRIFVSRIPLLEGALECVRDGHIPAGLKANREFAECLVEYDGAVSDERKAILFDPQTAGGLLISVLPEDSTELTQALHRAGVPAVEIGEVLSAGKPLITVVA